MSVTQIQAGEGETADTEEPLRSPGRPGRKAAGSGGTKSKAKRGVANGRVVASLPSCYGNWIAEQADDLGVPAPMMVRMLLMEAFKARGLVQKDLEAKYDGDN